MGLAAAVAIAGVAISAAAAAQQTVAAREQAQFQNQVARNNEIIADQKAEDARLRGQQAERRERLRTQQLLGRARADAAARGVVVDEGSALDITSDIAATGELDALTVRNNAEREALGFESQRSEFEAEGQLATARGRNALVSGGFRVGSTVLTGGSRVASRWSDFSE